MLTVYTGNTNCWSPSPRTIISVEDGGVPARELSEQGPSGTCSIECPLKELTDTQEVLPVSVLGSYKQSLPYRQPLSFILSQGPGNDSDKSIQAEQWLKGLETFTVLTSTIKRGKHP